MTWLTILPGILLWYAIGLWFGQAAAHQINETEATIQRRVAVPETITDSDIFSVAILGPLPAILFILFIMYWIMKDMLFNKNTDDE